MNSKGNRHSLRFHNFSIRWRKRSLLGGSGFFEPEGAAELVSTPVVTTAQHRLIHEGKPLSTCVAASTFSASAIRFLSSMIPLFGRASVRPFF